MCIIASVLVVLLVAMRTTCKSSIARQNLSRHHLLDNMSKRETSRWAAWEDMPDMCGATLARAARVFWCMYTSFSLDML